MSAEPRRQALEPGTIAGRPDMAYELFPARASTDPTVHGIVPDG